MPDIIQLLSDSVANQIAAGEVIQRPASVVKELVENAIDAGAGEITINLTDAGRTLIQVTDDGCGMSEKDAAMAFERHATSKIKYAKDLFAIKTMGFRGEALASIAAVADVELHTRLHNHETGIYIHIADSQIINKEREACSEGTNFLVKNLFFNVPARRKFLKANSTELRHIIVEIQRISLANPEIKITLIHNKNIIYELNSTDLYKKRIISIFGKSMEKNLIPVNTETSLINIHGFIGQPKFARKSFGEQFFFVNKRFMKHSFFHKAIMQSYEKILPLNTIPSYFLYFEINPANIDINIHPTKTEIKFEDEKAIWKIIHATIRESLGKYNVEPSIDFDQTGNIEMPLPLKSIDEVTPPEIKTDPLYNPFKKEQEYFFSADTSMKKDSQLPNWEKLYAEPEKPKDNEFFESHVVTQNRKGFQFKNRYILSPVKSGLMIIDQKRAHERILYEKFLSMLQHPNNECQQQLFPETFELNAADSELLISVLEKLKPMGFDIRPFGKNSFIINGLPKIIKNTSSVEIIDEMLKELKDSELDFNHQTKEKIAASLAKASAIPYGYTMQPEETGVFIDQLFACKIPNYSPSGKKTLSILPLDQIEKLLK